MGSVGRFVAGGCIALAAMTAYFLAAGAVGAFADGFVLFNLRHPSGHELDFAGMGPAVVSGFGASTVFLVVGLVGACLLPVIELSRLRQDPARHFMVAGCAAGTVAGLLWMLVDFDNWPDMFLLLPFAALGVAGSVDAVVRRVAPRIGLFLMLGVTALAVALGLGHAIGSRHDQLDRQQVSVERMMGILGSDVSIVSIEAPQVLVLAGKRNPSKYQLVGGPLGDKIDETWPGGLAGFKRSVIRQNPTLIAIGDKSPPSWARVFEADYQPVGCAPSWQWYATRTLDRQILQALEAANAGPCGTADTDPDAGSG
jgi:hypothetical protein